MKKPNEHKVFDTSNGSRLIKENAGFSLDYMVYGKGVVSLVYRCEFTKIQVLGYEKPTNQYPLRFDSCLVHNTCYGDC